VPRTDAPEPDERLHKQPRAQRSTKLSAVLDARLDALVALLNREGNLIGRVYRHDLIAALIALAPEDLGELEKLMNSYIDLSVRDALVGDAKNAKVIELRAPRPGRRTL
jgi:hypothetical protein